MAVTPVRAETVSDNSEQTTVDTGQNGIMRIQLVSGSKPLRQKQVRMTVRKIANMKNGTFVLCEPYQKLNIDLNQLSTAREQEQTAAKAASVSLSQDDLKQNISCMTDESGMAIVRHLEEGAYLITLDSASAGGLSMNPILASLPRTDEETGDVLHDITIDAKVSRNTVPSTETKTVKKKYQTGYESFMVVFLAAAAALAGTTVILFIKEKREKQHRN